MNIIQVADTPAFANDNTDYTAKFVNLIKSAPDYLKWFEEPEKIIAFIEEYTANRSNGSMLRFIGIVNGEEIAFVGISGMNTPAPEIHITVADGYRGCGYGKEILQGVISWLFDNTEKDALLYRVTADNMISEKLVRSIGGIFREPAHDLERATIKTFEIRKEKWLERR